jgi:hypothetical protein
LYANGYNLFTIQSSASDYIDPENPGGGIDRYPIMRNFNFGINVKLLKFIAMRKITYFTLILMMTLLSSCNDFLNLPPLNKITEDQIFGTEAGIESYMATLYNKLPIEDINYGSESGFNNWISGCFVPAISCDEAIHCEWPS